MAQCLPSSPRSQRRYNKARLIEAFAVKQYKTNGKGITYKNLLLNGLASRKRQAQTTLKHCRARGFLFTLGDNRPQQYYPTCLKSEISKKNIPIEVSDFGCFEHALSSYSLEGYVLPLLPKAPLHIHNLHFKVQVPPECYQEIAYPASPRTKGKLHEEIIGKVRVKYCFYPNGSVMAFVECSNAPFRLQDELDLSRLIAFFGQVRDRLVVFLCDKHERLVPDIMEWQLTQYDLNRDVVVPDSLQVTGLRIQIKDVDHLFRIYFKSMGRDTVCRVEESCTCSCRCRSAIETIGDILRR